MTIWNNIYLTTIKQLQKYANESRQIQHKIEK